MATGDLLADLGPLCNEPPASGGATFDTENDHPVYDFDQSTDESWQACFWIPPYYSGNGITLTIAFRAKTITSGNVVFQGAFERHDTATDLDSDSFASAQSSAATAVPATDGAEKTLTIAFTNAQIDGALAGEKVRLRINRDANVAGDTAAADVQLTGVKVTET